MYYSNRKNLIRFIISFLLLFSFGTIYSQHLTENAFPKKPGHIMKPKKAIKKLLLQPDGTIYETGSLSYQGDYDHYYIDAGVGDINLELSGIPSGWDLDLFLYDQAQNLVASSTNGGNQNENISYYSSSAQTYTIEVYCYSAGTGSGNYILSGTYPDPPAGLPDLVITNMTVSNQYPPTSSYIDVMVTVENQGAGNAGSFYLDLFYNLIAPPTPGMFGDEYFPFSGLNAGQQVTHTFTNIFNSIPARWYMYAYVDSDSLVAESDESNNAYGPLEVVWMSPPIQNNYPWPLSPHNVAHQINSVLNEPRYTTTPPHFHDGVDIQANLGTDVFTVSSGEADVTTSGVYVNSIAGTFFYYHLQNIPNIDGEMLTCFEKVGETDNYNHVHFNDGADNSEINPLRPDGITPHAQTPIPTIQDVWFIENENPNNVYSISVWGDFDIVAKINGWAPPNAYRMGVYKVGYSIDSTDPNDIVWTFQFNNWINGNPSDWAYYQPGGPHDPHPATLGHIFRVTNGPDHDGYLNFDNRIFETVNVYVWAEDTYGHQTNGWYPIVIYPTGIENDENNEANIPEEFRLSGNYPNPFNPETIIKYQVPVSSLVKIKVYNILGQMVKSLVNAHQTAGYYTVKWNGSDHNGNTVPSGVYVVSMEATLGNIKSYKAAHKVNLIK